MSVSKQYFVLKGHLKIAVGTSIAAESEYGIWESPMMASWSLKGHRITA